MTGFRLVSENALSEIRPQSWGTNLPGIEDHISSSEGLALTFDACGGDNDGLDKSILETLEREKIPATVFVSGKWIKKHPDYFAELLKRPLLEIENHGLEHRPLSSSGRSQYGVPGTKDVAGIIEEVEGTARILAKHLPQKPAFFRSGTAYYDEVGVTAVKFLGYTPIGFSVLGDAGATYSADEVEQALLSSRPGDIVIMHINRPEGQTAEGLERALPKLKAKGMRFFKLKEARPSGRSDELRANIVARQRPHRMQ